MAVGLGGDFSMTKSELDWEAIQKLEGISICLNIPASASRVSYLSFFC